MAIAAAGIQPAATRQGYVLRKLIRRAVRHAELLTGTDHGSPGAHRRHRRRVRGHGPAVARRRARPGATPPEDARQGGGEFAKTLRHGVEQLHHDAEAGATFDGDLAFRLADTLGYPAELSAEEAARLAMPVDPGWEERYEELREEQRARSRR